MTTAIRQTDRRDIALVGIGCRFPGNVVDVASFWAFLCAGNNAIGEIPTDRIDVATYFDPDPERPGKMSVNCGGFLERVDEFDAGFFGISPREADVLDPQQRLLLETSWEALEDAGQDVARLADTRTGVFIGQWTSDFEARLFAHPEAFDFYAAQGSGRYASSGRISYTLGLRGPSLTVDTACSSSLVAVHLAVQSIRSGESEMALAGAANVILQPQISIAYSQARMLARDGQCKFGDASGDGYVRSEGAAVIVLKSLACAKADGDRIYAIIRGTAVRSDGRSSVSMGTPSQTGQEEVLRAAYEDARVPASRVGYIEAHGTGTRAGDPVELKAIAAVSGRERAVGRSLFVGSAKTNWGHTEAAAGLAGLIKATLVLHHGRIPPSLHHSSPNPSLAWSELALTIPSEVTPFPRSDEAGVAGVTALGISGTNSHVVLEEARSHPPVEQDPFERWAPAVLLPLSAKSPQALQQLAKRMADWLELPSATAVGDICWTAMTRRTALPYRTAFVAQSRSGLVEGLQSFAQGDGKSSVVYGEFSPKIALVCPGQGAQWTGMARQLMELHPTFLGALAECDRAASRHVDYSIVAQLKLDPGTEAYRLDEISVVQPVLVALAIAYARLLNEFGVVASAVVGHSMGEVAAAVIAGVIDIDRGMQIVCRRSALMQRSSGQGAMAVVELPMRDAAKRVDDWKDRVNVAVSNSPRSSVISGEPGAVRQIVSELERDGVFCRTINVDVASHSPQMTEPAATLASELVGMATSDTLLPIWSAVLGRRAEGSTFDAAYWGRNLREPVRFADAVNEMLDDDVTIFVELGPHPVLLYAIEQTAQIRGKGIVTISCARREDNENAALLSAMGQLWTAGYPLAWDLILPKPGRFVALPLYPWQRERHWAPSANRVSVSAQRRTEKAARDEEALGWLYTQVWQDKDPPKSWSPSRAARFLIVGPEGPALSALQQAFAATGSDTVVTQWDLLDEAFAGAAADAADLMGIVLLLPESTEAPGLPIRALQAVLKSDWRVTPRLWVVSQGARAVDPRGGENLSIDHAAAWGGCRVIAEEHPGVWGGLVDLDPRGCAADAAVPVAYHILAADGEDQVAIRANRRFVVRLLPRALDASAGDFAARPDAAYLITGGLGYIGLELAKAMAARGARRLILMGRSALPPRDTWEIIDPNSIIGRRVAAVRALEMDGVAIHLATVDVSDESALRAFLVRYNAEAWPPIRGVIHSAGAVDDCLVHAISQARFNALLGPKLRGAQHLDRLLPHLDLFALMSSMATFLPHSGQANYAAANAGLDALALNRRARGVPATSIGWGVWEETGLIKDISGEQKTEILRRPGISVIPAARGADLFALLCQSGETVAAVLPIDWAEYRKARGARSYPIFSENMASFDATSTGVQPANRLSQGGDNMDLMVRKAVGAVLKIPPSRLDARKPLGAMGLTSLMAIELRNMLEGALMRPLSATLAWNHPTIEALVNFLGNGASKPRSTPVADTGSTDAAHGLELAAFSNLSDAEALGALRSHRDEP